MTRILITSYDIIFYECWNGIIKLAHKSFNCLFPCDCIAGHAAAFSDGMHDSEVNKFSNFSNLHDTTERSDRTWTYEVVIVNYFC